MAGPVFYDADSGVRVATWMKTLVLGRYKTGKTTFAGTWPNPFAICCAMDDGKRAILGKIPLVEVKSWNEYRMVLDWLDGEIFSDQEQREPFSRFPYLTLINDATTFLGRYDEQEADKVSRATARAGQEEKQTLRKFGKVKSWAEEAFGRVNAYPRHIVHTGNLKTKTDKDGKAIGVEFDFPGEAKNSLPGMVSEVTTLKWTTLPDGRDAIEAVLRQLGDLPASFRIPMDMVHLFPQTLLHPDFNKLAAWLDYCRYPVIGWPPSNGGGQRA